MNNITLRQISYFIAIAQYGSFRQAADRLNVTQPTLTAQIGSLEKQLELSLFERSNRGVMVTVAGRELLASAKRIEEEVRGFTDIAGSLGGQDGGTHRMGVTPTLGPYLLPHLLPDLHRRHSALHLYVREGAPSDLEQALKAGDYDLILSTLPIASGELEVAPLIREPLLLVMSVDHRLAQRQEITRGDLAGEAVLTIDEHHLYHRQISDLCQSLGASVRRDYEGTSLDTLRQMVVMGMGIAFLPALYVASEIRDRESVRVAQVQGVEMQRHHALAWRSRSPARTLFRQLAEEIREMVAEQLSDHVQTA